MRARNIAPDSENKIHDDSVARTFGFSGALVPGVELFAYLTRPLVEAWGVPFLTGGRLEARFRRPVYDGEEVVARAEPSADADWRVLLEGPDGDVRAEGSAAPSAPPVDIARFAPVDRSDPLWPTGPQPLPVGPLGSVSEPVDLTAHHAYLEAIDEDLALYRQQGIAHPGALLRLVNALLMRNVDLGPWIHTASDCRMLGLARLPGVLHGHGVITDVFERKGNAWVRYDALVLCDDMPVMHVQHAAIYRLAAGSAEEQRDQQGGADQGHRAGEHDR